MSHWFEPIADHLGPAYLRYSFTKGTAQEIDFVIDALLLRLGDRVLDIGCGPGHYGVELARRGASEVLGIDFAEGMIQLARERARTAGVEDRCRFVLGDILEAEVAKKYDYTIVMGFMDYVEDPHKVIERILAVTAGKAFISFPVAGGVLGWPRKLRYRSRCPLYLYTEDRLRDIFRRYRDVRVSIEPAARDFFVTLSV